MCGIAGLLTTDYADIGLDKCEQASYALAHRGPDDHGAYRDPMRRLILTHRRLAILDLTPAGHQPMHDRHKRFWIVFNGEIYNYRQLRKTLETSGYSFHSCSDTEVLLALYERHGEDCLAHLRGMFAFAVWDSFKGTLFIARDRYGVKPLYYSRTPNAFAFASEVRALIATGIVPRRLDPLALAQYCSFGSAQAPLTMITGVRSLMPGECITILHSPHALRYTSRAFCYDTEPVIVPRSRTDALRSIRELLSDSVRLHLVSDVPVGLFFSGGIDSTALLALAKQNGVSPRAVTIGFGERAYSESDAAARTAQRLGVEHDSVYVTQESARSHVAEAIRSLDQPSVDGFNTYVVSGVARQMGLKVALSGLGGDELFAGYPVFRRVAYLSRLRHLPAPVRHLIARTGRAVLNHRVAVRKFWELVGAGGCPARTYSILRSVFLESELTRLLCDPHPLGQEHSEDLSDIINLVSRRELRGYLMNTLLRDSDCMSMAHSLELRVPFVDVRLIDTVLAMPGQWKVTSGRNKPLLAEALKDVLPRGVSEHSKMGFTFPFRHWMLGEWRSQLDEAFKDSAGFANIGLNSTEAHSVWSRFVRAPSAERWGRSWALYVLKLWCANNGVYR